MKLSTDVTFQQSVTAIEEGYPFVLSQATVRTIAVPGVGTPVCALEMYTDSIEDIHEDQTVIDYYLGIDEACAWARAWLDVELRNWKEYYDGHRKTVDHPERIEIHISK